MKAELLSIGATYFQMDTPRYPLASPLPINKEYVGGEYELVAGSSALNFARVATSIGLHTVFVGKVGEDTLGQMTEQMIEKAGIIPALIKSSDVQTNTSINYIDPEGNSVMFVNGTANHSMSGEEVREKVDQYLDQVTYLYLGGAFKLKALLPSYKSMIEAAQAKGVKVCLDHGRVTNATNPEDIELMKEIVPMVDYYFPSKDELLAVWGRESIEEAIERYHKGRNGITVVKDAKNGATGVSMDETVSVPAFQVSVVNTVGAGDSFNAGFIKAQVDGLSLKDSVRFANAVAALKISQSGLPTYDQVIQIMNQQYGK